MRDLQEMAPPSGKYQLQFLWWVWSHCRNPEGSGTQEGKTYRGEAAEQDDAAAAVDVVDDVADAAVVAGQKPVGTVAAVREGREGEEGGEGMRDGPLISWRIMMMKCC